ncbi:hypothetical protein Tco_0251256 [Tanacetum coccineum]
MECDPYIWERGKIASIDLLAFKVIERLGPGVQVGMPAEDSGKTLTQSMTQNTSRHCFVNDDVVIPVGEIDSARQQS